MEARIEKLEEFAIDARERLMKIETRLDQTATKADVAQAVADMVRWVVGTAIALAAVSVTVMTSCSTTPPRHGIRCRRRHQL
jgi:3-oxoacyl-(acyl-carrier-protein) synthase